MMFVFIFRRRKHTSSKALWCAIRADNGYQCVVIATGPANAVKKLEKKN